MEPTVCQALVAGAPMRWLEVEHRRATGGALAPVVLVHGLPTSPELWRRVLPRIDGRALAWEMVGYGESIPAGRDREIGVARQAGYLEAWLEDTGLDPVILVGHDLGGGVAQTLAVGRPDLCAGLVLTNCVAEDAWPVWPVRMVRSLGGLIERLPERLTEMAFVRTVARMHADRDFGRGAAELHWEPYARHDGAAALVRQARSLDPADTLAIQDRLDLDLPVRVLWGDADAFLPVELGARLADRLGARLDTIPGGRHFTPEDHPDRIAEAIRDVRRAVGR